jgi:oligoribonuclease
MELEARAPLTPAVERVGGRRDALPRSEDCALARTGGSPGRSSSGVEPRARRSLPCIAMADAAPPSLLVWMDLEMTGLDPERERILEMATLITDSSLEVVAEGPELVVHQPDELLAAMDEWNAKHHGESGLVGRVRASRVSEAEAEERTLAFVAAHCPAGTAPLCGNSVWQDRRFLARYMPRLDAHLHYRIVDVSTVKELARRWNPEVFAGAPEKKGAHRALNDIRESLAELAWYRSALFR